MEVSSHGAGAGAGVRHPLSHRSIHQSDARSSGLSSDHGRVRGRQAAAVYAGEGPAPHWAMLNADDPASESYAAGGCGLAAIWYGTRGRRRSARRKYSSRASTGCTSTVSMRDACKPVESPLVGRINVSNILAAVGAGLSYGMDLATIARASRLCRAVPGTLRTQSTQGQPFLVVVDYAHTDDALRNVIQICARVGCRRQAE